MMSVSKAYINGMGCISPQNSIDDEWFFETIIPASGDYFNALEPSYKDYIAPNVARRMGRAIKMGVASASMALKQAGAEKVDAIVSGTGLGCFEDSERFLLALIDNNEQYLTPTSFIQSTHNTVGSQIALLKKCHDYNFTYVHRGFSFESCLIDALMLFNEGKETIIVGGIEEHTPNYVILNRNANKLQQQLKNVDVSDTKGIQLSEGAGFFVLSNKASEKNIACIAGVQTLYKPKSSDVIKDKLSNFLTQHHLTIADIDVMLLGFCGDVEFDEQLQKLKTEYSSKAVLASFKQFCGEYYTASAFATWMAAKCIQKQQVPEVAIISGESPKVIKHVLIINQYAGSNYSFVLVSKC